MIRINPSIQCKPFMAVKIFVIYPEYKNIFPFIVRFGIYTGSYNVLNISYLNSPHPPLYFIHPPLIHGIVSTDIIFLHSHTHAYIFGLSSTSYLYPQNLLLPTGASPILWAGVVQPSCSPIL
jgi:hypothetical protein